jgi:hypothetical protein
MIHASKLERFLGADQISNLQGSMRGWYGPPIAIARVPGRVHVRSDGDFVGDLNIGRWSSLADKSIEQAQQHLKDAARGARHHAGFSSLSDLISEATAGGKRREFLFSKTGATGVANVTSSLWGAGTMPAAGANASNAPGGDVLTSATTGAFPFANPAGGDTQHFVTGYPLASISGNTLLLYDRLFQVNKTMNSTATEAVTGVPTRYQSSTSTDPDYSGGNFLFAEVGGTALAATAHNWTVCQYTNQAGTAAQVLPSVTGASGAVVRRLDHPIGFWFAPLASGDTGIKALTQMQCDAAVATGVVNFVMGHPIAWLPCPINSLICVADGLNSAFNLARIFDNAALGFLEICKPSTGATAYTGSFTTVAG